MAHDPHALCSVTVSAAAGAAWVVALRGELDISNAVDVSREIAAVAAQPGARIVVDLSGLTFVDSSGFTGLVSAERAVEGRQGELLFAAPSDRLRHVIEIMQLGDVLEIVDSVEAAVTGLPTGTSDTPAR